jgi:hypothetical protein
VDAVDPEGGNVTLSYAWSVNGIAVAGEDGPTLDGAVHFDREDVVEATVTATAGTSRSIATARTVVANSAPSATAAVLGPRDATEEDTLACVPTGLEDPDPDDVPDVRPRWTVNGTELRFAVLNVLTHEHFSRGDEVGCTLIPTDGDLEGLPVVANPVVIADLPPTLTGAELGPATPTTTDTLTCTARGAADPDGDPVDVAYRWEVDGIEVIGETGGSLEGLYFDEGDAVVCIATPVANGLPGDPVASNALTIGNSPPSASGLSILPAPLRVGDVPTCELVGWSDPDAGDTNRASCTCTLTDTGGSQTQFRVDAAPLAWAGTLACSLVPTDEAASGAAVSGSAGVTHAPVATATALAPDAITTDTTVSWNPPVFDEDDDLQPPGFAWFVNDVEVLGVTGNRLDGSHFDKGDRVRATVTPQDSVGPGTPVSSPVVTVRNSDPTDLSVVLSPGLAREDDDLVCVASATDADGDALRYAFQWFVTRDGSGATESRDAVTTGNRSVLDKSRTAEGDTWECVVRVTDDPALSETATGGWTGPESRSVTVGSLATCGNPQLVPSPLNDLLPAYASGKFKDIDGDGDLDLLTERGDSGSNGGTRLFERTGTGFELRWTEPSGYICLTDFEFADLDGDGYFGVVLSSCDGAGGGYSGRARAYDNVGGILASTPTWSAGSNSWAMGLAASDYNHDGYTDVAVFNHTAMSLLASLYTNAAGQLPATPDWTAGHPALDGVFGDVDDAGNEELLMCHETQPARLYAVGPGGVSALWTASGSGDESCTFADVDGDGDRDIVTGSRSDTRGLRVYLNHGGSFASTPDATLLRAKAWMRVFAGDLNGDGRDEIVTASETGTTVYGTPTTGSVPELTELATHAYIGISQVLDVDGDGYDDIVTNDGNGAFVLAATCACDADADGFDSDACGGTDCDDGDPDVHPGQTAYFTSPNAQGTYDYDCDTTEAAQFPRQAVAFLTSCEVLPGEEGWTASTIPACGQAAGWSEGYEGAEGVGNVWCTLVATSTRTQACR